MNGSLLLVEEPPWPFMFDALASFALSRLLPHGSLAEPSNILCARYGVVGELGLRVLLGLRVSVLFVPCRTDKSSFGIGRLSLRAETVCTEGAVRAKTHDINVRSNLEVTRVEEECGNARSFCCAKAANARAT